MHQRRSGALHEHFVGPGGHAAEACVKKDIGALDIELVQIVIKLPEPIAGLIQKTRVPVKGNQVGIALLHIRCAVTGKIDVQRGIAVHVGGDILF